MKRAKEMPKRRGGQEEWGAGTTRRQDKGDTERDARKGTRREREEREGRAREKGGVKGGREEGRKRNAGRDEVHDVPQKSRKISGITWGLLLAR